LRFCLLAGWDGSKTAQTRVVVCQPNDIASASLVHPSATPHANPHNQQQDEEDDDDEVICALADVLQQGGNGFGSSEDDEEEADECSATIAAYAKDVAAAAYKLRPKRGDGVVACTCACGVSGQLLRAVSVRQVSSGTSRTASSAGLSEQQQQQPEQPQLQLQLTEQQPAEQPVGDVQQLQLVLPPPQLKQLQIGGPPSSAGSMTGQLSLPRPNSGGLGGKPACSLLQLPSGQLIPMCSVLGKIIRHRHAASDLQGQGSGHLHWDVDLAQLELPEVEGAEATAAELRAAAAAAAGEAVAGEEGAGGAEAEDEQLEAADDGSAEGSGAAAARPPLPRKPQAPKQPAQPSPGSAQPQQKRRPEGLAHIVASPQDMGRIVVRRKFARFLPLTIPKR